MRWRNRNQSENVEDRRGMPVGRVAAGGGLGVLILALVVALMGGDPRSLLQQGAPTGPDSAAGPRQVDPAEEPLREFVAVVLADTEVVWQDLFQRQLGRSYRLPKLVLFTGQVEAAGGVATAAMGPFYSPSEEKVYLDLSFCGELKTKFRAPGDFAIAYVVAHEIGHHVQKQIGSMDLVNKQRGRVSKAEENELSVRLELQADFLAGVWAHHAEKMNKILEPGDVEEALAAASAVGDDRLQKQARGYVVPDSFTHGTSAQRSRWFRLGLETGDLRRAKDLFELPEEKL